MLADVVLCVENLFKTAKLANETKNPSLTIIPQYILERKYHKL